MLLVNRLTIAQRHRVLDDVLEFPDVARVVVSLQATRSCHRKPLDTLAVEFAKTAARIAGPMGGMS